MEATSSTGTFKKKLHYYSEVLPSYLKSKCGIGNHMEMPGLKGHLKDLSTPLALKHWSYLFQCYNMFCS